MDESKSGVGASKKASLLRAVAAVAWGFLGIRKSSGSASDEKKINPIHLALVALACAGGFVGVLILIVRGIVQSGVAK